MSGQDLTDEEHQQEIERLAMEGAERYMAAQSDATIGLIGAVIFAFSGFGSTGGLIAMAIGLAGIAFFIYGLRNRSSVWTFLLGFPSAAIVIWKISTFFG